MQMLNKILLISLLCAASFRACASFWHKHHHHHHDHDENHHNESHHEHHHRRHGRHHHHHHEESAEEQDANLIENSAADIVEALDDESENDTHCAWYKCDKDLREARGLFDKQFLKKLVRNLNPFSSPRRQMRFYLFKREFPECGRELVLDDNIDEAKLMATGFNASLPTRIIIHGWMSPIRGSLNRDVKDAYLKRGEFNVIITDWSVSASNLNYFSVVGMIDGFGSQLARFTEQLNKHFNVDFDDIYLIGHSLGAQIAGAAGKHIKPNQFNTIFALDPAGPKFRRRSIDFRIDPTDAKYVESIQTSANLGFLEPTGNATFYPNYGVIQRKCFYVGCSHIRAYKMFAESINSELGFWGHSCKREGRKWDCDENDNVLYQMGGEPSIAKSGIFYVETNSGEPFAMGQEAASKAVIKKG